MNCITYQEKTKGGQHNYNHIYAMHHFEFQSVIDICCGSGNDTVYFIKREKQV